MAAVTTAIIIYPCYCSHCYSFDTEKMLGRVRPSGVHQKKTLDQLPWSVVRKLTQLLDRPHPDHHNWQALLSHCEVVGK